MSVSSSIYVRHILFRPADPKPRFHIGRWLGISQLTGDVSGGTYTMNHIIGQLGDLYGQYALWDIKGCTFICDQALTTPTFTLRVQGYEMVNNLGHRFEELVPGGGLGGYYNVTNLLPNMMLRTSDFSADQARITLTVTPNTNTVVITFATGGNLYDERYL